MNIDKEEELKLILNVDGWPNWPFLPMKRREPRFEIGTLINPNFILPPEFYWTPENMWSILEKREYFPALEELERLDPADLVACGWIGDW